MTSFVLIARIGKRSCHCIGDEIWIQTWSKQSASKDSSYNSDYEDRLRMTWWMERRGGGGGGRMREFLNDAKCVIVKEKKKQ